MPRSARIALFVAATLVAGGHAPQAQSQSQQTQTPPQQPVFRTATNFVQVDAYPTRDGKIVEGLSSWDWLSALEQLGVTVTPPASTTTPPTAERVADA